MSTPDLSAWEVDGQQFPRDATFREQMRFLLQYAILAPSSHNTQPWRFKLDDEGLWLLADRTRSLAASDPYDRELIISCGAALMNLRVAFAHFGCPVQIHTFPFKIEPDVLAHMQPNPGALQPTALSPLLREITRRSTNRRVYTGERLPASVCDQLLASAYDEGVELNIVEQLDTRRELAVLIASGDEAQFADPGFRHELASWLRGSRSYDGMPAYAPGSSALLDATVPIKGLVVRTFDMGESVAAHHEALAQGSPTLACISTDIDDQHGWLAAGQALQRILLTASAAGLDASFLNQPIEVAALRKQLQDIVGGAAYPQILLRIGRADKQIHTPRRPVEDVLC
ncbi:MAG: nitroreductase [Burkholderiales bacterium]|nr:nitroreductase [Burkholderiales bacterium]